MGYLHPAQIIQQCTSHAAKRMNQFVAVIALAAVLATMVGQPATAWAQQSADELESAAADTPRRLSNALTVFVDNTEGKPFDIEIDVLDINHLTPFPSELLVKLESPDGRVLVREVLPDDGIVDASWGTHGSSWASEAWYFGTAYSRGLEPAIRWSAFSNPQKLAQLPARTFRWSVKDASPGVYRLLMVGRPDHYVSTRVSNGLKFAVAGNPEVLHGHGDLYRRSYVYVPENATSMNLWFMQMDQPAVRTAAVRDSSGKLLLEAFGERGLERLSTKLDEVGVKAGDILTVDVSAGPGDFILLTMFQIDNSLKHERGSPAMTAVLAPDADTARAIQGGQILHDGLQFWQPYQVRMHEWLKAQPDAVFEYDPEREGRTKPVSVGSHHYPKPDSADGLMHDYVKLHDGGMLFAAIKQMQHGMRLVGHSGHVGIGPRRNMAYEMGCYSFFYHRPAWRILQQSDAPDEVKDILREFIIQIGDRLAFARATELGNGNALASLVLALRYCAEATQDPMQMEQFDIYWDRFAHGGFGPRVGIGPSGAIQEAMGYGFHYASYPLRGWRAALQPGDIDEPRIREAYDRLIEWFSYVYAAGEPAAPWSSRTNLKLAGGTYNPDHPTHPWKGHSGPNLTESVMGANEFFVARRPHYYAVTYHGRLSPTFNGEGFNGQVGFGGGILCQVHVPDKGQVFASTLNEQYGGGQRLGQWRNFHMHGLVGETADALPLVAANSEHFNAALDSETNTVSSSGEVRQSSVAVSRSYTFGEDRIRSEVSLAPSKHDRVFSLFYGHPKLRGEVREAYEVFPVAYKVGNRMDARIVALTADGEEDGGLTDELRMAPGFLVDQIGYGARVEFDQPRHLKLGENRTVMVQLVSPTGRPVKAGDVSFSYSIVPFAGPPPRGPMGGILERRLKRPLFVSETKQEPAVDTVAALLENAQVHAMSAAGKPLANVKLGVIGDHLAVATEVMDSQPNQNLVQPWKGSCIEVFASPNDGSRIGQVMLIPKTSDDTESAALATGDPPTKVDGVAIHVSPITGGYLLEALIPLTQLKLDTTAIRQEGGLFELQITGHYRRGRNHDIRRATAFGSVHAFTDNRVYARFSPADSE